KLHTLIETYHIPAQLKKKSGITKMGRVFRDKEELPLSRDLTKDIYDALNHSEWLIVIASPSYLESNWCNAELDYFLSLGRKDRVLTILASGRPWEAFPEQISYREENGVKVRKEPMAADVRGETLKESLEKLNNEKLRLLAPMLNVHYDELFQRDRKRKTRIFGIWTAAVITLLSGFLAYTLVKNSQITKQKNLALQNQMKLLIEQANISVSQGNRMLAIKQLLEADEISSDVPMEDTTDFKASLEYALYNNAFETIMTLDNDNRQFDSLVFSHNDRYLAGITNINSAILMDASTGKILHTVSVKDVGMLDSVGFTDDDKYFYVVDSWYGYVTLFDVKTGELFTQYDDEDNGMAWNIAEKVFNYSDHELIVVRETDLVIWDYINNTSRSILPLGEGTFNTYTRGLIVDLSPDRKNIVMGSHGYGLGMRIMEIDGDKVIQMERDDRGYSEITYCGNGKRISAASGTMYYVWDDNGKIILKGAIERDGVFSNEMIDDVKLNYDGSVLLVMNAKFLRAVDVKTGNMLWEKENESNIITEAVISPNGKYVSATGSISGVFDIRTGEMLCDQSATAFSSDSRKVIANTYTSNPVILATPEASTVYVETSQKDKLYTVKRFTEPADAANMTINLTHFVGEIYANDTTRKTGIYTSEDVRYAAYTHQDGFIEVYDISDSKNIKEIYTIGEHCYSCVNDLIFCNDMMASCGGYDPRCMLFDLKSGRITHVLQGYEYCYFSEFSKDGSKIIMVCGFQHRSALVYSCETGNLLYELTAPEGTAFYDAGFNEEGTRAIAYTEDGREVVGLLYPSVNELVEEARKR
ncbi:MAG: TIR domain-containing protein, partial [Erysipelotrichaceae bacterium]|nr:TIR domain-containing protein [Erysipelotrichaceae bacterium]